MKHIIRPVNVLIVALSAFHARITIRRERLKARKVLLMILWQTGTCSLIFEPLHEDGDINAAAEIPAGTLEKWEVDKTDGNLKLEHIDGAPRIINYLGDPANYGMIPRTLLPKESGGDGGLLDVIILGPAVDRGKVVKYKLIGVLYLTDHGEQDDKLIAVLADSPLYEVDSMDELNQNYNGIAEILQLWFTNYKGPGKIQSKGFGSKKEALEILKFAIENYSKKSVNH